MTLHEKFDPVLLRAKVEEFEQIDHNLLLLRHDPTHEASLLSFPVENEGANAGEYLKPPLSANPEEPGVRKVMGLAREHCFAEPAGPVFATLPVKPEPGSAFFWCYFINSKRLSRRRWTYTERPAEPPPSLLVAEDSGELRVYESVGLVPSEGSQGCRKALEAGFIVGTLPTSAVYGNGIPGTTAVVNLTPLQDPPGATQVPLPDLAIITPHDDAEGAKVFLYSQVGAAKASPPEPILPSSPLYEPLTTLSRQAPRQTFESGAALAYVQITDGKAEAPACNALVISARNLQYKNEWTRAEWASPKLRTMAFTVPVRPSLVVATPDGGLHKYEGAEECLPLARNTDVWHQLRNGCVLGTVQPGRVGGTEQLAPVPGSAQNVPLVNLSSLEPDSDSYGPGLGGLLDPRNLPDPYGLRRPSRLRLAREPQPVAKTRLLERKP